MKIQKRSKLSGKIREMDIPVTTEQLEAWMNGELIQDVMPNISADEREFLMTGITPEEWDSVFSDE